MGSKKKARNQNKARSKKVVESSTKNVEQPSETQTEPTAIKPNEPGQQTDKRKEEQNGEKHTDKQKEGQNSNEQTDKPREIMLPKETEKQKEFALSKETKERTPKQKEGQNSNEQTDKPREIILPKKTEKQNEFALSKETKERTPKQKEGQNSNEQTDKQRELALPKEIEKRTDKQKENLKVQTDKHRELVHPNEIKEQTTKQKDGEKGSEQTHKQMTVLPKETENQTNKQKDGQNGNAQTDKQSELVLPKDTEMHTDKQKKGQNSNELADKQRDDQDSIVPTMKPSQTLTESVTVKVPEVLKHPLENVWGFWLYTNEDKKNWAKNQKELTMFDTVEDYWCLYHHMKLPSELKIGQDYAVFKRGIGPMWEDKANEAGGRWVISLERQGPEVDRIWLDVVLLMIGENFQNSDIICGAVVNVRSRRKISVWTRNKNETANMEIGKKLKSILRFTFKIQFCDHETNQMLFYI